jgi:hypothetical protein
VLVERGERALADRGIERRADAQTFRLDRQLGQRIATADENQRERVKARDPSLRWPDVTGGAWMLALVLGGAPTGPEARPRLPAPLPAKNAVFVAPVVNVPRFGIGLGYDRAVHRRVTVGARFEYAVAKRGYAHLQGWIEGLALAVWAPRAFHGFFAELNLGVGHTVLAAQPRLHTIAIAPGATVGVRWRLGTHAFIGASGGLRWGVLAHRNPAICTFAAACPAVRVGPSARVAIEVGAAF